MQYLQRIYFNDKPLILTTDDAEKLNANSNYAGYTVFQGATIRNFNLALHQMELPVTRGCLISDHSAVAIQECLHNLYTPVDAGGGLVYNDAGAILMIFRRGKWDLPKGKLDKGETIEECALREVREETGLKKLSAKGKIVDTFHIYTMHDELMLKRTTWFRMHTKAHDALTPQLEEDILEARWVDRADVPALAPRSYEAIREVLRLEHLI